LGRANQKKGNPLNLSSDFDEIKNIRTAEAASAATIEMAKKNAEALILNAEKESQKLYDSALSKLRTQLEKDYINNEDKIHHETRDIIDSAKAEAEMIKQRAIEKIPGAVDRLIKMIVGGGN